MATVGFNGLGRMGAQIVKRLLDAGHQVTGYNRTPAKADWLVAQGLQLASSPREVATAATVVLSMVANDVALKQVAEGKDGILAGLTGEKVYADLSTVSPQTSRELADQVRRRGCWMVDAPVMAGVPHFEQQLPLLFLVGGDLSAIDRLRPILESINATVFPVGPNGAALVMKAALNLQLPLQVAAAAEGLVLAEQAGIPRETAIEAMLATMILPEPLRWRINEFIGNPAAERAEAWHAVTAMQKDLGIALQLGHDAGAPLPLTATVDQLLTVCRGLGLAERDFTVLYHTLQHLATGTRA